MKNEIKGYCKDCEYFMNNYVVEELDTTDYEDVVCIYHMSDGFTSYDYCSKFVEKGEGMKYSNDFKGKKKMVKALAEVYKDIAWSDIADIELKKYRKEKREEEFVVLTWINGGISTANNNMNSLSATARNIARMLDGGVYENIDYYKDIMTNEKWEEII